MAAAAVTAENTSGSSKDAVTETGAVIYCSTEQEYYQALDKAGPTKLVVVVVFAEWYVIVDVHEEARVSL